ncbi:MAG TPA: Holliday junction branch migration protein RuvA [Hyphomicrobiaceae bacterium]|nr:Holliday junction branch migration protein RuvA [Hyphomicrobiaceae bacterium]
MIGKLRGKVDAVGEAHAVIDVNGVGYEVNCSARTLRSLKPGDDATLSIETHVREDAIRLFGFTSEVERSWFRTLQSVQGVGAKVALSVLSVLSPQDLASAIALQNWGAVAEANGVGKKLAQRITAELRDKAPGLSMLGIGPTAAGATMPTPMPVASHAVAEAISGLVNLGYQPAQAAQAVAAAQRDLGEEADTAKLLRRGLKELAR